MANKKEPEPLFEPIATPKRNFEIIEASIRREIYSGTLAPGQKLPNEFELARQFNVGRSAVREALKVLELAGLLVVKRGYNGGTFIAPPDAEYTSEAITLTFRSGEVTLEQLLEACMLIEVRSAEIAATEASDLEINDLDEIIKRTQQSVALPGRYLTAIIDFYVAIAEMSHNAVFVLALNAIRNLLIQEFNHLIGDQQLRLDIITQQQEIWQKLETHNVEAAGNAMRSHLSLLSERLRQQAKTHTSYEADWKQ